MLSNAQVLQTIYPTQGILSLLGRAWQMVRLNLKESMLLLLCPSLVVALANVLMGLSSSSTFLVSVPISMLILKLLLALGGFTLWIGALFYLAFSYCTLARLYYSAIVEQAPLSLSECWQHTRKNWGNLILVFIITGAISGLMIFIDLIIFIAGIFISQTAFAAFQAGTPALGNVLGPFMTILFMIIWGFIIFTILITLISLQLQLMSFPCIAIATSIQHQVQLSKSLKKSFQLIFSNIPRLVLFAVTYFLFALILSSVLHLPVGIWAGFEFARLGPSVWHHGALPVHVQVIINLWSSLVNLILLPFYISALTLIWYDCQVRKEGLDLKLWLRNLSFRRNKKESEALLQ